jgi:hypothetical protein
MLKRKHLNHYASKLTASLLTAGTECTPETLPPAPPAGYRYRMQLQDAPVDPTVTEFVDVTAVGAAVTIARATEDAATNPARDWIVDPGVSEVWLVSVDTAESHDKLNGVEIVRYTDTVATVATGALTRSSGGILFLALAADTAITWDIEEGEKQELYITPTTWSVTAWGIDHWMTDLPDFSSGDTEYCVIAQKAGGNIYGWAGGSHA